MTKHGPWRIPNVTCKHCSRRGHDRRGCDAYRLARADGKVERMATKPTKPTKRKRTRFRITEHQLALAWISPTTAAPLERLAKLLGQHERDRDFDSAEAAGLVLDRMVPTILRGAEAVARAERRKGRKLTKAEVVAVAARGMGLKVVDVEVKQ